MAPFQLSGPLLEASFAAERLSVLMLGDMKGKPAFDSLVHSIQTAGFSPRTVREEDFAFNVTPRSASSVVVPVGSHVSAEALNMLGRYITAGGRVILIPSGETPDASVGRLFAMAGMPVSGITHAPHRLSFNWKGLLLPSGGRLSQSTQLLMIQPNAQMEVLATWGSDIPAIATTSKGAVLNWQWGRELSDISNIVALSKVVYPGKADPLIMLQQNELQPDKTITSYAQRSLLVSLPPKSTDPLAPQAEPNPALSGAAKASSPAGVISIPPVSVPEKPTAPAGVTTSEVIKPPSVTAAETSNPSSTTVITAPPQSATVPQVPAASSMPAQATDQAGVIPRTTPAPAAPAVKSKGMTGAPASIVKGVPAAKPDQASVESRDTEVLNNILGIPAEESVKAGTAPATPPATSDTKSGAGQQKHFSFLDPEAASVLAPAFDYGVYSMNLRKLDDYKRRVREALEAGRQLSLDIPENQVNALLKEADLHKRKFESLYLGGQTQAGLDENTLARHAALQALALTTTSPQVEGRAIWLDRGSIIACGNADGLRKKIQKLHQSGINIVYFETVNAGFPIYPSKIVKHNPMVNGWDPLKVAIDEGHKQGMEVHAWVWCFAVGNRRHNAIINQPDDYAGPILTEAGMMGEALRNHEGGLSVDSHQHEFWLSPASPKARDFLVSLYKEIVSNYDVDGLQLDYIRYPFQTAGNKMGYEAVGRERFTQSTGKSLDNMDEYTARVWTAWKTYQVTSFVQQVSTALKKIKPELKLSAAVFPMHRDARIAMIQQDWETWIDNGWIDTLSPMSYTSDPARLQEMFEYVEHSPRKHMLIYPGVALFRLDGGQLVQQLEAVRQKGGLGTTFFAGSHLDDDKANTLAVGPYKQINSLPPHQDVVKSMQTILADYQDKLEVLRKKGMLKDAPQMDALQGALQRLEDSLNALGSGRPMRGIPVQKLKTAHQRLNELQVVSQNWSSADKADNPYRAEYFERDMLLMGELMGYTLDKLGLPSADKMVPVPVPSAPIAATVKMQPTGMLGAVISPTAQPPVTNLKPASEPTP